MRHRHRRRLDRRQLDRHWHCSGRRWHERVARLLWRGSSAITSGRSSGLSSRVLISALIGIPVLCRMTRVRRVGIVPRGSAVRWVARVITSGVVPASVPVVITTRIVPAGIPLVFTFTVARVVPISGVDRVIAAWRIARLTRMLLRRIVTMVPRVSSITLRPGRLVVRRWCIRVSASARMRRVRRAVLITSALIVRRPTVILGPGIRVVPGGCSVIVAIFRTRITSIIAWTR